MPLKVRPTLLYRAAESCLGRQILAKKKVIDTINQMSPSARHTYLVAKLITILKNAEKNVPYYHRLFAKLHFNPERLRKDLGYFNNLPYLSKKTILANPQDFLHQNYARKNLHRRKSAGSTGYSIDVFYSQSALDWTAAANLYAMELAGKRHNHREIHISTKMESASFNVSWRDRMLEFLKCLALNRKNILIKDIDDDSLDEIWRTIVKFKPHTLQGHPSTLHALALYLHRMPLRKRKILQSLELTGELLDKKRQLLIEQELQAKVFNRYGSAEFGVVAHSLDDPFTLKVLDFMVYPENFDLSNGKKELVFTTLTNEAMPLIRYRSGDWGEINRKEGESYITNLFGRVHDIFVYNGVAKPTHVIKDLFDRTELLHEFQIIRNNDLSVTLKVVPKQLDDGNRIKEFVTGTWGPGINIDFVAMQDLDTVGIRSKFFYFIDHSREKLLEASK